MKKILLVPALLLFFTGSLVSCSSGGGETPEENTFVLKSDKTQITANGVDQAAFIVTNGTTNVTNAAEIWKIGADGAQEKLESAVFATDAIGSYKFEARYTANGEVRISDPVIIEAVAAPEEIFYRKIFVQEFTATSCPNCPKLAQSLKTLEASEEWKDRMLCAAFHGDYILPDPMRLEITTQYCKQFNITGFPACVLDLIPDTFVVSDMNTIRDNMKRVLADYPATCGIAIDSKVNSDTRKVEVNVKVKASQTNEYRITAFLLEDGIIGPQNDDPAYEHNQVVRVALAMSLNGDKLGTINADAETTKKFTATLAADWKVENMRVVVCVLNKINKDFYGTNSAECPINGSVDYKYNEK